MAVVNRIHLNHTESKLFSLFSHFRNEFNCDYFRCVKQFVEMSKDKKDQNEEWIQQPIKIEATKNAFDSNSNSKKFLHEVKARTTNAETPSIIG